MKIKISTIKEYLAIILVWLVILSSVISIMKDKGWGVSLPIPLYIFEIIVVGVLFFMQNGKLCIKKSKWIILFSLYIMICTFLNLLGNSMFNWYMRRTIEIALAPLIGYYLAQNIDISARKIFYSGLYIASIGAIIYGFINYFADLPLQDRADSIFGHAIPYSTIIAIFLFMTNFLITKSSVKIILYVFFTLGIISTFSRSSWIAIIIVALLLLFSKKKKNKIAKKSIIKGIVLSFIIIIGIILYRNQLQIALRYINGLISNRISGTMGSVSALQRLGTIGYMIEHIGLVGFLVGHGNGQGGEFLKQTTIVLNNFATTDNQYISILYDFGLFGIVLVGTLFVKILKTIWERKMGEESVMLASVILVSYISAFFYELLGWINVAELLLILVGIYYNLEVNYSSNKKRRIK